MEKVSFLKRLETKYKSSESVSIRFSHFSFSHMMGTVMRFFSNENFGSISKVCKISLSKQQTFKSFTQRLTHKLQCFNHIEITQVIRDKGKLTGFYMRGKLVFTGLIR